MTKMGEVRNAYRILVRDPLWKSHLRIPRMIRDYSSYVEFKEVDGEDGR
jgi:hypothetical protein